MSLVAGVIVSAAGNDTNNALAIAGSGGLFAGDGANAATSDNSHVNATIGANSFIEATSIQIAASHTDNFGEMADSLNAGLVGASAALSSHEASSNVGVAIGDGVTLYATAAGLSPCLNGGCTPAIDITASNKYVDASSGTEAGAGGGINGAGATSTITFDNGPGATITIGAGAILSSGYDPVNDPGSIAIIASTNLDISDTDSLTTGGLIEGAGVNSEVGGQSGNPGQINNSITIGGGAAVTTYGILDIGTYTTGDVNANAYVSTYGIAGVGEAIANVNLTSNQTITVLASTIANQPTIINGFGDVNITAGDYIDGGYVSLLFGDTNAEAYVRGLIAVPVASAGTTIATNATVNIANTVVSGLQTSIGSGANVTINADEGNPTLESDGTGHGYELGFIPVTNGSDNTSAPTTSVVTIGADVVAGEYHTQNVTINSDLTVTEAPGGAPLSYASTPNFDILTFLNDDFNGPGSFGNLVSTSAVPTISLGALYASGGVIRVKADTLAGSGTLTAYGAPTITVTDNYPIYLILAGGAYIPDTPGGAVVFNGAAGLSAAKAAGITVSPTLVDSSGAITVTLTYGASGGVGNSSAGPGLFNTAPLTNVGGLIALYNDYGSIGSAGTVEGSNGKPVPINANITADQSITYEPNGAYVFQADDASGNYIAGGSAYSEWASAIVYPGGTPSTSVQSGPDANAAMEYVATSIALRGSYNGVTAEDAGNNTYWAVSGTIPTDSSLNPIIMAIFGSTLSMDLALYGSAGNTYPHSNALVLFGSCIQGIGSSSCLGSGGYNIAKADGHYGNSQQPNYVYEGSLSYGYSATGNTNSADNESLGGSAASQQIYGSYVAITAATIDVNGSITVGKSTSYSADVSAKLGAVLVDFAREWNDIISDNWTDYTATSKLLAANEVAAGFTSAQINALNYETFGSIDVTPFLSLNSASASLKVPVTYNATTNQISFGDISTFSSGASVKLDGDIVSTNTLGNIHVNAGYGSVSITNETQIGLDFSNINTGSAAGAAAGTSTVMITNRLIDQVNAASNPYPQYDSVYRNGFYSSTPDPQHAAYIVHADTATYIYNPATGLKAYLSDNGTSPVDSNGNLVGDAALVTLPSGSTASSTTYQTVIGAEFEFVQEAILSRTVTQNAYGVDPVSAGGWIFSSGPNASTENPWYYVNPSYISGLSASGPVSSAGQSKTPVGQVILSSNVQNGVNQDPAFQETIVGNTVGTTGAFWNISYTDGDLGFATQSAGDVTYSYYYPNEAFLRLTTTIKADNPFGISFGGNGQGSVSITGYGSVILGGAVTNSTGQTYISSQGTVTQTATASTTSNSLYITDYSGIGSSGTPLDVTLSKGDGMAVGSLVANVVDSGDVHINLNSGANGFEVEAGGGYGTVVVNAAGTLASGAYGFSVAAANVTLTSTNGSIGSASSPLPIISGYNYFTGSYFNVTANISASGDIGLTIPHANLLVGQIASTSGAGNITINVPNGGVYSAVSQTPASSLTNAQVANIVSSLNLEAGSDAAAGAVTITSFQNTVNSNLTSFAAFLANGSIGTGAITLDPTTCVNCYALYSPLANAAATQAARTAQDGSTQFTSLIDSQIQAEANTLASANGLFILNITSANRVGFQMQAAAALGIANPTTVTDPQIQAWANAQYENYAATFTQAYGASWQATVMPTQTQTSAALTGYQALLAAGTVTNGVFSLTNADPTTSSYAAAAATANGVSLSQVKSAQIQAYANNLYQSEATVFAANVNAALGAYPSLAANGTVASGVFTLNASAVGIYQAAATAANMTVQAYANSLYQGYATVLSEAYGANWQAAPGHATAYSYDFTVASGSALATSLTQGANWTPEQLVDAIDVSAFKPASGNVGSNATPNIVGHDVNITVGGTGSVGTLTTPISFSLAQLASDSLTPQDQAAIAVATTPGSVQLTGKLANGQPLPAGTDLDNLPPGATVTGLILPQTAPIFVSASGAFTVQSAGAVYLQGTTGSSVTLNSVSGHGDVYVAAPGSILASTEPGAASTNITTTGNINLNAGTGSIGSSTTPVTIQTGGVLTNASGGGDVYLSFVGYDAEIQRVSAGGAAGTASITTGSGYSILSDLTGINVEAPNIILNSGGTIGTSTTPFAVLANTALTASAAGAAYIGAPTVGNTQNNLTIASLVTPGDLWLNVTGALTVAAGTTAQPWTIDATTNVSTTSETLVMNASSGILAGGSITLDTAADATVGQLQSTFAATASGAETVSIFAGGSILSNADGLDVTTAGTGGLYLSATTAIGSAATPLHIVAAPALTALTTASTGAIYIEDDSALDIVAITAPSAISLTAASLTLPSSGSIQSGVITLDSTASDFSFAGLQLQSTSGDIDITSAGAISGGTAIAYGSANFVSATSNNGTSVTATNGSVTLIAGALSSPAVASSTESIDWSSVSAGSEVSATSGGSLTLGTVTSGTANIAGTDGDQTIDADGAINLTSVTATAGTLGIQSYASTVSVGSAQSDGAQTIEGNGAVSYSTLSTTAGLGGSIDVTSDTSSITGNNAPNDTLTADGSFDLEANGANGSMKATSLTAMTGTGTAKASGAITLKNVTTPAGALGVTSTGSTVALTSATSGGAQTIVGEGDVSFTTLTTTKGSGGAIDVTSETANIDGGSVSADGSASVTSATQNKGNTATSTNGGVTLASGMLSTSPAVVAQKGEIGWSSVSAGTEISVTSGGTLTLGTVTSGTVTASVPGTDGNQTIDADGAINLTKMVTASDGTLGIRSYASTVQISSTMSSGLQTIEANGQVSFTQLTTAVGSGGGIDVTSDAANIKGGSVSADGSASLTSATSNDGMKVSATNGSVTLASGVLTTSSPVVSSTATMNWSTVSAGTQVSATSGGTLTLGTVTSGTVTASVPGSNGDQTIDADGYHQADDGDGDGGNPRRPVVRVDGDDRLCDVGRDADDRGQ